MGGYEKGRKTIACCFTLFQRLATIPELQRIQKQISVAFEGAYCTSREGSSNNRYQFPKYPETDQPTLRYKLLVKYQITSKHQFQVSLEQSRYTSVFQASLRKYCKKRRI